MPQFPDEQSSDGAFERQEDAFRTLITKEDTITPQRFHLYVCLACPWASRVVITRHLLGLESSIGMTIVDPIRDEKGWAFREGPGHTKDPINGFNFLSEAYLLTEPTFKGRVTVPVLWDTKTRRIVNNSEDDICRLLHDTFPRLPGNEVDLFPPKFAERQAHLSKFIYDNINNGVYEAGFASSQAEYEKAAHRLFLALDEMENRLKDRRFLFGAVPVETDWRLFCSLIRFDAVYHGHFKCNLQRIIDYPNLFGYLLDLYQLPGIDQTVNMDHIKRHYYYTHDDINPTRIVPIGPLQDFTIKPNRERLA